MINNEYNDLEEINSTEDTPLLNNNNTETTEEAEDNTPNLDDLSDDLALEILSFLHPNDLKALLLSNKSFNSHVNAYISRDLHQDSRLLKDFLKTIISAQLNKKLNFKQKYINKYLNKAIEVDTSFITKYKNKINSLSLTNQQKENTFSSINEKLQALVKGTKVIEAPKMRRHFSLSISAHDIQLLRMLKGKNSISKDRYFMSYGMKLYMIFLAISFVVSIVLITPLATMDMILSKTEGKSLGIAYKAATLLSTTGFLFISSMVADKIICPEPSGLWFYQKQNERYIIESINSFIKETNDIYNDALKEAKKEVTTEGQVEVSNHNDENKDLNTANNALLLFNTNLKKNWRDTSSSYNDFPPSWDSAI